MSRFAFPGRLRHRTPLTVTVVAGTIVVGVLGTMAFAAPGYSTQEVEIDGASVWVANGDQQMVGLANTELLKLSTATAAASSALEIVQGPERMLVHKTDGNTLDVYDPAEVIATGTVPLPQGAPRLAPAKTQLMMYEPGSGDVWISRYEDLSAFDAKSSPDFGIGVDSVLAADDEDRYVGYSSKSGQVTVGALSSNEPASTEEIAFDDPGTEAQATLVAGVPVVYDPASAQVWVDGQYVSVAEEIPAPETAVLMKPTTVGDEVLIAFAGGLVSIDVKGGQPVVVADGTGIPAAPVRLDGCDYAVWSGGDAYRDCGTADRFTLASASGATPLLAVNGKSVVATEPSTGLTWAIQRDGGLIDNWLDFEDTSDAVEEQEKTRDVPPELDKDQKPPNAVDDEFGVRAGRANRLPVLLNDSDPNGDAIVIKEVPALDPTYGRLELITDDQELQVTVPEDATGTFSFEYTITDGFGGEDSATVTVTIQPPEVNNPPYQARSTRTSVAAGRSTEVFTLGDWVDPEGDPIYLAQASTADPDRVSYSPEGALEFTDGGGAGSPKNVALVVSDGSAEGVGSIDVTVHPIGTAPIIAENFAMTGYVGQEILVEPLGKVRGGNGPIALNSAKASQLEKNENALSVVQDYDNGRFTVVSTETGTHFVEYSVTDTEGSATATAMVRLEIRQPPEERMPPVTVPTTAFLSLQNTQMVDVLATDYDPAGEVLSISAVGEIPEESGIIIEIVEQRILRVTLRDPLEDVPHTIPYEVTNGYASATGTLTLIEIPEPAKLQPPVAEPDTATARVGSLIDIPVLDNDHQPDGKPLTLDRVEPMADGQGTIVASGNVLRYLAPDKPGEYSTTYQVSSTDGQYATARVSITVRDIDVANNRPPIPKTITARVGAGQTTTIPIPLGAIDPDGDLVTLVGPGSQPQRGVITNVGTASIEYTAEKHVSGTDVFTYVVTDALGATSKDGVIRVGVVPDATESAPPIAMDDSVTARPGTSLSIDVTANDSDPAQSPIMIVETDPLDTGIEMTSTESSIRFVTPREPGDYGILYTIANATGMRSSAWLHVKVDPDAPPIAPFAQDVVLTLEEIDGRPSMEADVLSKVTFAEGTSKDLHVDLPAQEEGAEATPGNKVRVDILPTSRIIPFRVARVDDPSVSSTAFLWVPGTEDARPQLKTAPALKVVSGEKLTIPIADHVIAANGRKVTLEMGEAGEASATHSNGADPRANETTLEFVSAPNYFGPAAISFTVTDGRNRATLNLPITVLPAEDQAAVLQSASVQLESGTEQQLDLWGLTDYPGERSKLTYAVDDGGKGVVTTALAGSQLTLRPVDGAKIGQQVKIVVSVRDTTQPGTSGTITATIVQSTKPRASAVADDLTIRRGSSETIDVLANDESTNPFPGRPLRVVSVGDKTPVGVRISTSSDKRTVTVSVAKDAQTGSVTVPYQIADATEDPARYATGVINIRIQDVPDAPGGAPRVAAQNENEATATLAIPHAFPNFSDITTYVITTRDGGKVAECANPDACVVKGLVYGQPYEFSAAAVNAVGQGPASPFSATLIMDVVPNAPGEVTLATTTTNPDGHSMQATWSNSGLVVNGTSVETIEATLSGPGVTETQTLPANATSVEFVNAGIVPGSRYEVGVRAKNKTHWGAPGTASTTAIGPPSASRVFPWVNGDNLEVHIQGGNANGGGALRYQVAGATGAIDPGSPCNPADLEENAPGGIWSGPLESWDVNAKFVAYVSNGTFCRAWGSEPMPAPPQATGTVGLTDPSGDFGTQDIRISGIGGTPENVPLRFERQIVIPGVNTPQTAAWNPIAGDETVSEPQAYGRSVEVRLRACLGANQATCGEAKLIGTVLPLQTGVSNRECLIGAPPRYTAPVPTNNGLVGLDLQIQYSERRPDGQVTPPTAWQSVATAVPEPSEGNVLIAHWRVKPHTSSTWYVYPDPTTCL